MVGYGLSTQRECLEMLGCYGRDKVNKLAEIIAGVVLAGNFTCLSDLIVRLGVESRKIRRNR